MSTLSLEEPPATELDVIDLKLIGMIDTLLGDIANLNIVPSSDVCDRLLDMRLVITSQN